MSRSNPSENGTPNPAVRWFEWNGEAGTVRYYDKEKKENVDVGSDFTMILLDRLGTVGGWHDPSGSSIYANEVKDTRQDVLVVKSFKGGLIAEGFYRDIKDRVNSAGGQFVASCYVAFKHGDTLEIGNLRFKGAALGAWMDFEQAHRAEMLTKAIRIKGYTEGKKGRVVFRVPVLQIAELSEQSNAVATGLDLSLQKFLSGYLKRTKGEQVHASATTHAPIDEEAAGVTYDDPASYDGDEPPPPDDDDQIPF